MANTFSQIYLQFVFAVNGRRSLIAKENKEEPHKYITELVQTGRRKCLPFIACRIIPICLSALNSLYSFPIL
jgi:hypothetical protein